MAIGIEQQLNRKAQFTSSYRGEEGIQSYSLLGESSRQTVSKGKKGTISTLSITQNLTSGLV